MKLAKAAVALVPLTTVAADLRPQLESEMPSLVVAYKDLHGRPELSHHEERTAALFATELRKAGFTVTERVGKYSDGAQAFGVVGVLKNGPGPALLVRTELDALPVEEKTGLPYASRVRTKNDLGQDVGVMHACGHDLHMTSLIGSARLLARLKDRWSGTLIVIGQPSEETIDGAKAMLADGLYSRFPKPDMAIALHDTNDLEAGKVAVAGGPVLASSTAVTVTMRGQGGHGARPETTRDPVVMAAEFVLALQTLVSRQNAPTDPAVVTVGSIHGGTKHNVIPDEVVLQISTRSYSDAVRAKILEGIGRTARGVAQMAGVPEDRAPIVKVSEIEYAPVTFNDPRLAERLKGSLTSALGDQNVVEQKPEMVSEDFGLFGLEGRQIPTAMFRLGAADPQQLAANREAGKPMPSLHSSIYYPQYDAALRTGIIATVAAVLDLLKK
jgi:hippurate hydrolase